MRSKLDSLYKIAKNINKLYEALLIRENNAINIEAEKKMYLEALRTYKQAEHRILSELSYDELFSCINIIDSNLNLLVSEKDDYCLWKRVRRFLIDQILLYPNDKLKPDDNTRKTVEFVYGESANKCYGKFLKLDAAIKKDLDIALLSFVEEEIQSTPSPLIKAYLRRLKYAFALADPNIEQDLLSKEFIIGPQFYSTSQLVSGIQLLPQERYKKLCDINCNEKARDIIENTFKIKNEDLIDEMAIINLIINRCVLRACLVYSSDEERESLEDLYKAIIVYKRTIFDIEPDNSISESVIIECFNKYRYDRERSVSLSLKLPI